MTKMAHEAADEIVRERAQEIAREQAHEEAKEEAQEAYEERYKEVYEEACKEAFVEAYKEAYEEAEPTTAMMRRRPARPKGKPCDENTAFEAIDQESNQMNRKKRARELVAHHEAAHAVIARILGISCVGIFMFPIMSSETLER
jgi:hypothetical protein